MVLREETALVTFILSFEEGNGSLTEFPPSTRRKHSPINAPWRPHLTVVHRRGVHFCL